MIVEFDTLRDNKTYCQKKGKKRKKEKQKQREKNLEIEDRFRISLFNPKYSVLYKF